MRRSPTHPTLASTLSSSFRGGGGGSTDPPPAIIAAEDGPTQKDKWQSELQPIPSGIERWSLAARRDARLDWKTGIARYREWHQDDP